MLILLEKGGPVMWPLVLLSFFSMTFIIERSIFFWKESSKRKPLDTQRILSFIEKGKFVEAEDMARRSKDDYISRTLLNGIVHREYSLSRALETQALNELRRMKKYLPILDTIITSAPLLGILGTVIGIISSFQILSVASVADPMSVTKGIAAALITTAYGLVVALGTLIPYNIFQSRYQAAAEELESNCSVLEIIMQKLPENAELISNRL